MSTELFFIYDSHCPWSYAATPLVTAIANAFPEIKINLFHAAYYDGETGIETKALKEIESLSSVSFFAQYKQSAEQNKDSTLAANLLSWVEQKSHGQNLALLQALQQAHFEQGNDLTDAEHVEAIIDKLKLSPPRKCLQQEKLAKEAELAQYDIDELQEYIGTQAIPALLLAHNDELVLLNHNLYIGAPNKIVDAVKLELK